MPELKRPLKVFLCHARDDKSKARELYRYLKKRGIQPWLDAENLLPGQNWPTEIHQAIETSDAIIICLSKSSVDKEGYVQKEIKFALDKALEMPEGRIFIIPARLDECEVPYSLKKYQWVDLFDVHGYSRLMKSLKERASQLERATVQVSKQDEKSPYLAEKPKQESYDGVSVRVNGNVQGNIIIGNDNVVQPNGDGKEEQELELKRLESQAIQYELKGDFWNARKTWYEIKRIDSLFSRVDIKIAELERELNHRSLPRRRQNVLNTQFIVATIIAIIIIIALIGFLPQLPKLVPTTNTVTSTLGAMQSPATLFITLSPTETLEPSPTLTETSTPFLHTEITDMKDIPMMLIKGGEFTIGSSSGGNTDEQPAHSAYLDSFYMDKYEVTNTFYKSCVDAGACDLPMDMIHYNDLKYTNNPVVSLNWDQARLYCEWREAQLPTEAQWEIAARGTTDYAYPWGDDLSCDKANYVGCVGTTTPVGSYLNGISPYGIYDMSGNVWEWVADWYAEDYYQDAPYKYPQGPDSGQERVLRGGAWDDDKTDTRVTNRYHAGFELNDNGVGFRCARSVP